ncbi:uncharacterized protein LOC141900045 isoform X2 [Tubulanus polymorphus]|uniref:uncharacterized protein LOC141900045 isoform X2 n=1 Tax=Tubulanus polymorphus TaxID=672921 RepID=UPI003DA1DB17
MSATDVAVAEDNHQHAEPKKSSGLFSCCPCVSGGKKKKSAAKKSKTTEEQNDANIVVEDQITVERVDAVDAAIKSPDGRVLVVLPDEPDENKDKKKKKKKDKKKDDEVTGADDVDVEVEDDEVEKTKISSMFENIVNHSMVGGGTLSKAAITTQEGNIYANCPADFLPTVDQIQLLVNAVQDPNLIQADKGICLGDMSFMYKEGKDAESIYGITADGDGGCIIIKTKRCMMIGIYDKKADDARTLVEDLADYLCGRNL